MDVLFETGDVVCTQFSALKMTVRETLYIGVVCDWFDYQGQYHQAIFSNNSLILVESESQQRTNQLSQRDS
jgi:uncharacterized protein YodC (DUF2158 family)